jgi:hypothetical protein
MGIRLDLIIGMDVMGYFPWLLDWQGKKITFDAIGCPPGAYCVDSPTISICQTVSHARSLQ